MLLLRVLVFVSLAVAFSDKEIEDWMKNFDQSSSSLQFELVTSSKEFGRIFCKQLALFPTLYPTFYSYLVEEDSKQLKKIFSSPSHFSILNIPLKSVLTFNSTYFTTHWLKIQLPNLPRKVLYCLANLKLQSYDSVFLLHKSLEFEKNEFDKTFIELIKLLLTNTKEEQPKEFADSIVPFVLESD